MVMDLDDDKHADVLKVAVQKGVSESEKCTCSKALMDAIGTTHVEEMPIV